MSDGNPQGTGEQGGAGHEPQGAGGPPHWGPDGFSQGAGPSHGGYGVPPGGARGYGPPEGGDGVREADYGAPAGFGTPAVWSGKPPPNYLPWAIIATIGGVLFSLIGGVPTGLVSAHFARQVMRRWHAGDRQGALEAARKARIWATVSTVLDVLGLIFVVYLFSSNKNGTVG
ncbi:MAG TPA: CD225/dispanin family protein [Streptosporangiaceae bacterium]|nr:CD225/dispanin family protein [Streptosporangiaceae bacterium]